MSELYYLIKVLLATMVFDVKSILFDKNSRLECFTGVRVEPGFLNEEKADQIYKEISSLVGNKEIDNSEVIFQERGAGGYDQGMLDIKNIDRVIPDFLRRIEIEKILAILKKDMGLDLKVSNINCYWNQGVQSTRGLHADNHTKNQYKAFIYLTDVLDDLDGPYCYVPASHKSSFNRYKCIISNYFNKSPLTDFSTADHISKMLKIKGPKGSLIISNQNGAHRGWPQGEENKRALISINLI